MSKHAIRHHSKFLLSNIAVLVTLGMTTAVHSEPANAPKFSAGLERHWTSNALDGPRAIADWYTLLRGSIERQWGDEDTNASLRADVQATRFNHISIENDRAFGLSAQAFRRFRPGLELRGSLNYHIADTGDDLTIGPFVIGTRARKQIFGANTQLGLDLGNSTSLILNASESYETSGPTHFEADLIAPVRLDPDINRLQLAAKITRTVASFAFGISASALILSAEQLGFPPVALSLTQYGLRGEMEFNAADGSSLGVALGVEGLRGTKGIYTDLRPVWRISFAKQLPYDLNLRGTWFARHETADSDDPLASWLQRAELEAGMKVRDNFAIASGIFWQIKQNLLLDNEDRSQGIYAEATFQASKSTAIVLRVDYSKTLQTIYDVNKHSLDAFVGVRAKI